MKLEFKQALRRSTWSEVPDSEWLDWRWQMRQALSKREDFAACFELSEDESAAFEGHQFKILTTPYYASLARAEVSFDPVRRIFMPHRREQIEGHQQQLDPLGEKKNQVTSRLVHRYSDRVLFWVTDTCSVYCRYCTRKHFTGKGEAAITDNEHEEALDYIRSHKGIREVILSGGDPLTLSDKQLERIFLDLRTIEHVEIIRIGSRMPVVNPFRITPELVKMMSRFQPVYMMTHFNHPRELTQEAFKALSLIVDHGIPTFNQMVLLNGVNNHPAIVQALSRRLLYARVKPYYMFQCDPSEGTDHLRNSVDQSLEIQKELWGHLSGLAMPTLSVDIPDGGGKTYLVPNHQVFQNENTRTYRGWDGVESKYISPLRKDLLTPLDAESYAAEWEEVKRARGERT